MPQLPRFNAGGKLTSEVGRVAPSVEQAGVTGKQIQQVGSAMAKATETLQKVATLRQVNENKVELNKQVNELTTLARQEKDPGKRDEYLSKLNSIPQQLSGNIGDIEAKSNFDAYSSMTVSNKAAEFSTLFWKKEAEKAMHDHNLIISQKREDYVNEADPTKKEGILTDVAMSFGGLVAADFMDRKEAQLKMKEVEDTFVMADAYKLGTFEPKAALETISNSALSEENKQKAIGHLKRQALWMEREEKRIEIQAQDKNFDKYSQMIEDGNYENVNPFILESEARADGLDARDAKLLSDVMYARSDFKVADEAAKTAWQAKKNKILGWAFKKKKLMNEWKAEGQNLFSQGAISRKDFLSEIRYFNTLKNKSLKELAKKHESDIKLYKMSSAVDPLRYHRIVNEITEEMRDEGKMYLSEEEIDEKLKDRISGYDQKKEAVAAVERSGQTAYKKTKKDGAIVVSWGTK